MDQIDRKEVEHGLIPDLVAIVFQFVPWILVLQADWDEHNNDFNIGGMDQVVKALSECTSIALAGPDNLQSIQQVHHDIRSVSRRVKKSNQTNNESTLSVPKQIINLLGQEDDDYDCSMEQHNNSQTDKKTPEQELDDLKQVKKRLLDAWNQGDRRYQGPSLKRVCLQNALRPPIVQPHECKTKFDDLVWFECDYIPNWSIDIAQEVINEQCLLTDCERAIIYDHSNADVLGLTEQDRDNNRYHGKRPWLNSDSNYVIGRQAHERMHHRSLPDYCSWLKVELQSCDRFHEQQIVLYRAKICGEYGHGDLSDESE